MTAMLASVTGPDEAETAIAGGADIVDMKDPAAGALGALTVERIAETLTRIDGRRPASAVTGDPAMPPDEVADAVRAIAATGVDYVKVGLFPPRKKQLAVIATLKDVAKTTRLVAVLFADKEREPSRLLQPLADAGFAGAMLDTADKKAGRLLTHKKVPALSEFVKAARAHGLMVGLAGGLEEPDIPRLLALQPDFLGFRGALCDAGKREAGIDPHAVAAIRRLIPRAPVEAGEAAGTVDYSLLSARGYHPDAADPSRAARIFVRDFVLPVRIGAYSHEREKPQMVRFDVSVEVRPGRGAPHGMAEVFSYDLVTDAISRIVAEAHVDFVETLAERIATEVLSHPQAGKVTVRVEKLEVGPGGVGVELTMDRSDHAAGQNPVLAMLERDRRETR